LSDVDLDADIVCVDAEDGGGANRGEHVAEDSRVRSIRRIASFRSQPEDRTASVGIVCVDNTNY